MAGQPMPVEIAWEGELLFQGTAGGRGLVIDGNAVAGCSPMELLAFGLAGCMAVDVVHILGRMRAGLAALRVSVEGTRAEDEPRRFTKFVLRMELAGKGLRPSDIDRALSLSREKYCSVYHSLRGDVELETSYSIVS